MFLQALDFVPVVFGGPSFLRLCAHWCRGSNSAHSCFVQSSQCFKTSWANIFNEKWHLKLPSSSFSCKIRLSELGQCPCSSGHHNHPRSYKKCPHSHSVLPPVFSFPTVWKEIISLTVGTHPCPPTVSQAELGHVISLNLLIEPGGRSCHYFSLTDDNTEALTAHLLSLIPKLVFYLLYQRLLPPSYDHSTSAHSPRFLDSLDLKGGVAKVPSATPRTWP